MEKIIEQGYLYDFYGGLLTDHQKQIYESLIDDNMSLNEIANEYGISKQAVHDLIRRCDSILAKYEKNLHLFERFQRIHKIADEINQKSNQEEIKYLVAQIIDIL